MNKTVLLSDYELIESFQQGNTRAFDTLIDRYQEITQIKLTPSTQTALKN